MRIRQYILTFLLLTVAAMTASAQVDKREVRRGNRDFKKENYKEAEIEYRKAIVRDSLSVAANYNLAADLYRQNNSKAAQEILDKVREQAAMSGYAADYFYNLGDAAIANQDWQTAVDAFQESLLRNPSDLQAKENYIYAKKKLEQQQQQQDQQQNQQQDQQQDQQQNDQNQDGKNDQNQDNQDNKDNQDNQQDQNQDNQDQQQDNQDQQQQQQPKITPQAAQQMLQAIQAKEKETQDKVQKEKAQALQSKQKERNW